MATGVNPVYAKSLNEIYKLHLGFVMHSDFFLAICGEKVTNLGNNNFPTNHSLMSDVGFICRLTFAGIYRTPSPMLVSV
jgi:hypothetical protein